MILEQREIDAINDKSEYVPDRKGWAEYLESVERTGTQSTKQNATGKSHIAPRLRLDYREPVIIVTGSILAIFAINALF